MSFRGARTRSGAHEPLLGVGSTRVEVDLSAKERREAPDADPRSGASMQGPGAAVASQPPPLTETDPVNEPVVMPVAG